MSFGFAVAGLRAFTAYAHIPALYVLVRSGALVVAAAAAGLFIVSVSFVAAAAAAMILVQGLDVVIGAKIPDRIKTVEPAITAAANAVVFAWMLAS